MSDCASRPVDASHWDRLYASGGYGSEAPDSQLVQLVSRLKGGTALDIGAGEGRHALFLAQKGFRVDAMDISPEGMQLLRKRAAELGVSVNCQIASARDYSFEETVYDLVVCAGFVSNFFRKAESKQTIERIKRATRQGGYMYICVTTTDDPGGQRRRQEAVTAEGDDFYSPSMRSWVTHYRPNELRECFSDCEVLHYEETTVHDAHPKPHTHVAAFLTARRQERGQ